MDKKQLLASWRLANKVLKNFLFTALFIVTLVLVLRLWPECFALGEEIGNVVTTMCLSYIMGFTTTFLWGHVKGVGDLRKNRELRENVIEIMAAGHNYFFKGIVEVMGGIAPFEPPDYTTMSDTELNRLAREGYDRQLSVTATPQREELITDLHREALEFFQEEFEDIDPFIGQFHPTFVIGLNRIRRELKATVRVGENGVSLGFHAVQGPLIQLGRIRNHIQWIRRVSEHITLETRAHMWGAIPMVSFDELKPPPA